MTPRTRLSRFLLAAGLAVTSAGLSAQTAQTAAPASAPASEAAPVALPTVQTDMKRGAFIPYKQLNEVLTKLRTEGEGLFSTRFKIMPKEGQALPDNTRLALMNDDLYVPIKVDGDGVFELPTFPTDQAKDMELGSNLPKGSTALSLSIDLSTPPEQLDMATVRRVVKVGQHLRSEILPWYARWLFPQIDGVIVCSDTPRWSLNWAEGGQRLMLALPADAQQREPQSVADKARAKDAPARACTLLTGQESWPDAAKLMPPEGANTRLWVKLRSSRAS